MNCTVFFAFLVADISALLIPGTISNTVALTDDRVASNSIVKSIKAATQSIKDAGLDPLYINNRHVAKFLPVAALVNCEAFVEDFLSTGLGHIVIHKVNYRLIASRFNFDIELPLIDLSVLLQFSSSKSHKNYQFTRYEGIRKMDIQSVRIAGQIGVNIGVFSGISSKIKLVIQGKDYSAKVNNFFGSTVPNTIKAHNVSCDGNTFIMLFLEAEVNELLEVVLMVFITCKSTIHRFLDS